MFHACKFLKSHQQHEKSANIKVILNIIFIIMLNIYFRVVGFSKIQMRIKQLEIKINVSWCILRILSSFVLILY